MKHSKKK